MQRIGPDRTVKNKWLWKGMKKIGLDIINIAADDVKELRELGLVLRENGDFVSANLISEKSGNPLVSPYIIKKIFLPKQGQYFRVGFIGFSSPDKSLRKDDADYFWEDPLISARKWLPELNRKSDFVIVLACMPNKDVIQLAIDNSNVDIFLNGFKHQWSMPTIKINDSTIIYAEDEAKSLGELSFSVDESNQVKIHPLNYRLTKKVKDDAEMGAFMLKAKAAISSQQNQLALVSSTPNKVMQKNESSNFVTSKICGNCHAKEYTIWGQSAHAHSIDVLKKEKKEFDTQCVVCHVTGSGEIGGFKNLYQSPDLVNVQCEACHGQGRKHSQDPIKVRMESLSNDSCLICHNQSNSPEFDFVSYWAMIKH
ncbi:MAG: hypothetical protein MK025_04195 [Acidobacteriia bacterium]|nr:hypothetical protein [Terriglobia bacterium]